MMASLGSKVQRGLDAGCRLMVAHRSLLLSDIVLASMVEQSSKISALIVPGDWIVEERGDGFFRVRMWCTLRVC